MHRFIEFVNGIVTLPESEERKLREIVQVVRLPKGEAFINEGSIAKKLAFVASGLFRYYYVNRKGSEYTKGFFAANTFISAYSSMVSGIPSSYTIEALEDSEIMVMEFRAWDDLARGHACWSALLIAMLQKGYIKKEKREREFLLLDAKERYEAFLEEYPQLEGRIKQTMIASYLGITPVALSRIRSGRIK